MRAFIALPLVCLLASCESQADPPASAGQLELGTTAVDYGAAISPAGDYYKALFNPDEYPEDQRMTVRCTVTLEDGTAVGDLSLFLFPVGEEGPELILGTEGGLLTGGNPKATTDADGQLTIVTGPLWEFADRFTLGLLHQRSPDRPFDLAVLPLADKNGMATFEAGEPQREIDLGTITLAVEGLDQAVPP